MKTNESKKEKIERKKKKLDFIVLLLKKFYF